MKDHTVTEYITQRDGQSSAILECSCHLTMVVKSIRKTPLRVARKQLEAMHKNLPVKEKVEPDFEKPRSVKKLAKQQKKVQEIYEETENNPEIDDPELPEGYQ